MILLYCAVYHCGWYRSDNSSDNYTVQLIEVFHSLLNSDLCKCSFDFITHTDSNLY